MDEILYFLYNSMPVLHIAAALAFIVKLVLVFRIKGFNPPAAFTSFLRIYSKGDRIMTNNSSRQQYMKLNNLINYYLYAWALITLIMFIVFQAQ